MMTLVRDLDHAVDLFEGELARRGRKPATRQKYRDVLYPLVESLERAGVHQPWDVRPDHCREYLNRWVDAAPSTMALYVSILTQFFTFLHEEEIITENPMARIKRPRLQRPEELDVTTLSSADVHRLFAAAREWDEILCMAILAYLGPRRSAAAQARRRDVDLERGTIRFREKGGKVITKPLPNELAAIIAAADEAGVWAAPSRTDGLVDPPTRLDAYLIPNRRAPRGRTRSSKVVYAIVKRLGERAGVEVHPHALRAAFAVSYLDRFDGDTYGLQKLMGHTRPETTQVYLRRHDDFKAMEKVRDLSWGGSREAHVARSPSPGSEEAEQRPRGAVGPRLATSGSASAPLSTPSEFRSPPHTPPTGFEPVLQEDALPEPLRLKLEALRARSSRESA